MCCDATNEEAVSRLRTLKRRPAKPFAIMAKDETVVKRECIVTPEQEAILTGHQKPILLLDRRSKEYIKESQPQSENISETRLAPSSGTWKSKSRCDASVCTGAAADFSV